MDTVSRSALFSCLVFVGLTAGDRLLIVAETMLFTSIAVANMTVSNTREPITNFASLRWSVRPQVSLPQYDVLMGEELRWQVLSKALARFSCVDHRAQAGDSHRVA